MPWALLRYLLGAAATSLGVLAVPPPHFSSLGLDGGWLSVISGLKELFLGEFSTLFLMFDYPEAVRVSCSK